MSSASTKVLLTKCSLLAPESITGIADANDYLGDIEFLDDIEGSFLDKWTFRGDPLDIVKLRYRAAGSAGKVMIISAFSEAHNMYVDFAVKVVESDPDDEDVDPLDEISVIKHYSHILPCPAIIPIRVTGGQVIMPMAHGDLYNKKFSPSVANQIVLVVGRALMCLYSNDAYYFDIKPMNIMYQCVDGQQANIFLADLGSVVLTEGNYKATYPPPRYIDGMLNPMYTDTDALYIYSYQLSILYMMLVDPYVTVHMPVFSTNGPEKYIQQMELTLALMKGHNPKSPYTQIVQAMLAGPASRQTFGRADEINKRMMARALDYDSAQEELDNIHSLEACGIPELPDLLRAIEAGDADLRPYKK